jgi:hypothetical protein
MKNKALFLAVRKRTEFLDKIDQNIEARNQRIQKLKARNWFILEAAPQSKHSYTK